MKSQKGNAPLSVEGQAFALWREKLPDLTLFELAHCTLRDFVALMRVMSFTARILERPTEDDISRVMKVIETARKRRNNAGTLNERAREKVAGALLTPKSALKRLRSKRKRMV